MKNIASITLLLLFSSCGKEFLEKKPSSNIVVPSTIDDYIQLLENPQLEVSGSLRNISSDEYYIRDGFSGDYTNLDINAYFWRPDIYQGNTAIDSWTIPYTSVFYANTVISGLNQIERTNGNALSWDKASGWAHFVRAYAFYDLVSTFSKAYDSATSSNDLGIPLRLSPDIDVILQRATLAETYKQIIEDAKVGASLLPSKFENKNKNRPSKMACYSLLARVFISMRAYKEALQFADSALTINNSLSDFNMIDTNTVFPFNNSFEEVIYRTYPILTGPIIPLVYSNTIVDSQLIKLYKGGDLRIKVWFTLNGDGNYNFKSNYSGVLLNMFSGLAIDELYLIKSEASLRMGDIDQALHYLNLLMAKRFRSGQFFSVTERDPNELLKLILEERRKELVVRGVRWTDLKRLNKDGMAITLTRRYMGESHILPPNDNRYVLPIPDNEVAQSNLIQNPR